MPKPLSLCNKVQSINQSINQFLSLSAVNAEVLKNAESNRSINQTMYVKVNQYGNFFIWNSNV